MRLWMSSNRVKASILTSERVRMGQTLFGRRRGQRWGKFISGFVVQILECDLFCSNTLVTARKRTNKPVRYTKLERLELKNMFKPTSYWNTSLHFYFIKLRTSFTISYFVCLTRYLKKEEWTINISVQFQLLTQTVQKYYSPGIYTIYLTLHLWTCLESL